MCKKFLAGILMTASLFTATLSSGEVITQSAPLVLVMLGPPGAGKGTQATLLHDQLHIPHISTGELLREHVRNETDLGKKAQTFMSQGHLVPDSLILDMLFERVSHPDCLKGYILDGFPRTLLQAKALQERLEGKPKPIVINLALSDEKIVERLGNRVSCEKCGTPYHLIYSPPHEKGKCDKCQGKLIQRSDDTQAVIEKRLKVYHEQTAPLIDFYTAQKMIYTVNCDASKDKIFSEVVSHLPKAK